MSRLNLHDVLLTPPSFCTTNLRILLQVVLRRRSVNTSLLPSVLPFTLIGTVWSVTSYSTLQVALIPAFGACLLGVSLATLWLEMRVSSRLFGKVGAP